MSLLIKNGRIITATDDYIADVFIEGETIKAIGKNLSIKADKNGVKKIVLEQGQMFDPNLHEVMFEVPNDNVPSGSVLQVIEEGYTIHDRLLRPARVGVAKNAGATEARINVSA